jgi:hypothetical protein
MARCSLDGQKIYLGLYPTIEQASTVYQDFKKKIIYITIERYDNFFPINVSIALYNSINNNEKIG